MQLLEKLGLRVEAEADGLMKVGVGLDPRRKTVDPILNPKPSQVGATGIMACENARSESEWSLGRPAASPTCRGHQGEGAEDAHGVEGARGTGVRVGGSGGVEGVEGAERAERAEGAEGAEGRECRGVQSKQRLQKVQRAQRLQWVHTHGAEGIEATEGAGCSRRSSRSAAAVHRRWPPPPGGPTRLWPACGSCPWPWRTAQASAHPLPGAGCREGAERE